MVRKARSDFEWAGVAGYLLLVNALSWWTAGLLARMEAWGGAASAFPTRLLAASTLYFLVTGWQPLLAAALARRWMESPSPLDEGWRTSPRRYLLLAWLGSLALIAIAALTAWAGSRLGWLHWPVEPPAAPDGGAPGEASPRMLVALLGAFALTVSGAWLQCLAEEVGWRGFLLTRLVARLGGWRGLLAHGLAWGLWYAPLVQVLAWGSPRRSALQGAGFLVTCVLLGCLLGWLRLASRSILPAVLANLCLTLGAGLPLLLLGEDVGLRGAVYAPAGWMPLGALLVLLAVACRQPWTEPPGGREPGRG